MANSKDAAEATKFLAALGIGTIGAALIGAIQAITVATINFWATKSVAIYTAHRVFRETARALAPHDRPPW